MIYFKKLPAIVVSIWFLTACGGGANTSGSALPTPTLINDSSTAPLSDLQATNVALQLWRNDSLAQHPKGSCAGCHGADFLDLARIGSSDTDMLRRAVLDGATQQEAKALIQAVKKIRGDMSLPAVSARSFRPFQPGGSVLLPDLTDQPHVVAVKRDIAFGEQLKPLLPTLMGARINSLSMAKKARAELLDILEGTNVEGNNPKRLTMRSLPTGVLYPLWAADAHHGPSEGTFNDWTADIAHDPKPERRAEWLALQDKYLANPNNENFWRMYYSARDMTRLPLLGSCTVTGFGCEVTDDFNKHKFLSALIGQHMMRLEQAGTLGTFAKGPVAFSYLDTDPTYSFMKPNKDNTLVFLPSALWEVGDNARVLLDSESKPGSFKSRLAGLGYPEFAQNSIDANRSSDTEETSLRLAWFWIGFTFDPSLSRVNKSNATRVGEYMVASLFENRYFNHNALTTLMRLVSKGSIVEANVQRVNNTTTLARITPKYTMDYGYAWAYGRASLTGSKWNESRTIQIPQNLKDQSSELYAAIMGNGFRMSMYLQLDQLDGTGTNQLSNAQLTTLRETFSDQINESNGSTIKGAFCPIDAHFKFHHPAASLPDDVALMEALYQKLGLPASKVARSWPC